MMKKPVPLAESGPSRFSSSDDFTWDATETARLMSSPKPTYATSSAASAIVDQSPEIDLIFRTLISMNQELNRLFAYDQDVAPPSSLLELSQMFHTVSDESGILRLRHNATGEIKKVEAFIPSISTAPLGVLRSVAPIAGIGLAGLGVGALTVGVIEATAAEGLVAEAALIGLRAGGTVFINPIALVITALLSASLGVYSGYQVQQYAASIQRALELYNQSGDDKNDPKLAEAMRILENEKGLGDDGRWAITRAIRWLRTPYELKDVDRLVRAKVHARQKRRGQIELFAKVFNKAVSKEVRAMCLLSQLTLLLNPENNELRNSDNKKYSEAEIKEAIDNTASLLNENYTRVLNYCLSSVLIAYREIAATVENRALFVGGAATDKARSSMDKILSCQEMSSFRYIRGNGKISELSFTFIQALCNALYVEFYKQQVQNGIGLASVAATQIAENRQQAIIKLSLCQELQQLFSLNRELPLNSPEANILLIIRDFTRQYRSRCDLARQVVADPERGLFFRERRELTPDQLETAINDTLRDDPEPDNPSLREFTRRAILHRLANR